MISKMARCLAAAVAFSVVSPCGLAYAQTPGEDQEIHFDAAGRGYATIVKVKMDMVGRRWAMLRPSTHQGADFVLHVGPAAEASFKFCESIKCELPTQTELSLRLRAVRQPEGNLALDVTLASAGKPETQVHLLQSVRVGQPIVVPWLDGSIKFTVDADLLDLHNPMS